MVFRRAPNLKDNLVRAKLPRIWTEGVRGCFRCGKARSQVCSYMSEGSSFRCNVSGGEYDINNDFNCDSSGVVYLLCCKVCGKQYVGSTFTSFRARLNNYKSSSRKFSCGVAVTQAELFRHFTEANHHGFLEDVNFQIIDRVFGVSRQKGGFWQLIPRLHCYGSLFIRIKSYKDRSRLHCTGSLLLLIRFPFTLVRIHNSN